MYLNYQKLLIKYVYIPKILDSRFTPFWLESQKKIVDLKLDAIGFNIAKVECTKEERMLFWPFLYFLHYSFFFLLRNLIIILSFIP